MNGRTVELEAGGLFALEDDFVQVSFVTDEILFLLETEIYLASHYQLYPVA